jgi:hypothetical protein
LICRQVWRPFGQSFKIIKKRKLCDSFLGVCSPSNLKQQSTKVFLPHTQCKPEENCAANLQTGVTQHENVEFQDKNAQTQR